MEASSRPTGPEPTTTARRAAAVHLQLQGLGVVHAGQVHAGHLRAQGGGAGVDDHVPGADGQALAVVVAVRGLGGADLDGALAGGAGLALDEGDGVQVL